MVVEARELVRLQPYEASSYLILARALEWNSKYDEALNASTEAEKFGNSMTAKCTRASIEAAAGHMDSASRTAAVVHEYWLRNPFETLQFAQLMSRLVHPDEVVQILVAGYDRQDSSVLGAAASPYFRTWGTVSSFQAFRRKLGLKI
jgi:hypothetical protein